MSTPPASMRHGAGPRLRLGLLVLTAAVAVTVALWRDARPIPSPAPSVTTGDTFTLAFAGDTIVTSRLPDVEADEGFRAVADVLRRASVAMTNLEQVFAEPRPDDTHPATDWPIGGPAEARDLARLGVDVVIRANNRAVSGGGAAALDESRRVLETAGLAQVGAGADLARSREPLVIGSPPHRLAVVAVAISSTPETRATASRGEIKGRAGVNPLRFTADITVDAATFAALQASAPALQPEFESSDTALTLFGRSITKGERTHITFAVDREDETAILEQIDAARRAGHVVVVVIHSHEPSNHSQVPAEFVRQFAHAAIDRGASLVVGHGPHQVRGIEVRGGGLILYSLGNFVFPYEPLASRDADLFDAGTDLYALALGALDGPAARTPMPIEAPEWWEGVVAVTQFERGVLQGVRLHPIDLGVELAPERRGTPRTASAKVSRRILERLHTLSTAFATPIRIVGLLGAIDVAPPARSGMGR